MSAEPEVEDLVLPLWLEQLLTNKNSDVIDGFMK